MLAEVKAMGDDANEHLDAENDVHRHVDGLHKLKSCRLLRVYLRTA